MSIQNKIATVFGGTGFIGRQIVQELAHAGYSVRVPTRIPERAYFLKLCGAPGQIVPLACNVGEASSLARVIEGADLVVNCIGIAFEKRRGDFVRLHSDLPAALAKACKSAHVKHFVHLSIPGVEKDTSRYARTKLEGEKAILEMFPTASILRPSLVFGPDDAFFNKFAKLMLFLPVLPLIGGGRTLFQPVYVGDVAKAVMACVHSGGDAHGKIYELGGPEIMSLKDIFSFLSHHINRPVKFISLPWWLAKIQAFFMGWMPTPLLTCDQVKSLKTDYIVSDGALSFDDLGIKPLSLEMVLPTYLRSHSLIRSFDRPLNV